MGGPLRARRIGRNRKSHTLGSAGFFGILMKSGESGEVGAVPIEPVGINYPNGTSSLLKKGSDPVVNA
jgi:hypothetical protein